MLKDEINKLRKNGLTFDQIAAKLDCSKGTISYHLSDIQKQKTADRRKKSRNKSHPYKRKIESFSNDIIHDPRKQPTHKWRKILQLKIEVFSRMSKQQTYIKPLFTVQDVVNKFGEKPKCYLTGKELDIYSPRTYAFDHKTPRSRGGSNHIDNLGLCSKEANSAKSDMTPEEFINLCKSVLEHNGYKVSN